MFENLKEKILLRVNTVTGSLGFLSGYQVCHTICLSAIAFLSFFGISINFLPFLFLQKYNLLFWSLALVMLLISLILLYLKPKCMPKNAVIANAGIIIAAIPFQEVENFQIIFWITGLLILVYALFSWWTERKQKQVIHLNPKMHSNEYSHPKKDIV